VFLSYASQDGEAARRICEAFRAAGIEVWLDQSELRGGDAWDASIRRQIKACTLFIPIISANTKMRVEGYFRLEWKLAVDRSDLIAVERAFIVPVVIDETADAEALVPDKFRDVQWTRLAGGNVPAEFVERISLLLSRDDHQPPPRTAAATLTASGPHRAARRNLLLAAAGVMTLLAVGAMVTVKMARNAAIGMVGHFPRTPSADTSSSTISVLGAAAPPSDSESRAIGKWQRSTFGAWRVST
jgi:TIR domain